jgi:hypothetical protein
VDFVQEGPVTGGEEVFCQRPKERQREVGARLVESETAGTAVAVKSIGHETIRRHVSQHGDQLLLGESGMEIDQRDGEDGIIARSPIDPVDIVVGRSLADDRAFSVAIVGGGTLQSIAVPCKFPLQPGEIGNAKAKKPPASGLKTALERFARKRAGDSGDLIRSQYPQITRTE